MSEKAKPKKTVGRNARNLRAILLLVLLAGGLALLNAYTTRRDVETATGPANPGQKAFFIAAADRPDIETFFKSLKHEERIEMSKRIGDHQGPKLAELAGKLLNSFDAGARKELTSTLKRLIATDPESVADLLKLGSSFQRLGVFETLDTLGAKSIPLAVARMDKGDMRANAAAYLLPKGQVIVPPLLELLESTQERDTRLAISDVMGKLRAKSAATPLTAWIERAKSWKPKTAPADAEKEAQARIDESNAHLVAVASIGAPESEELLLKSVDDGQLPGSARAQCLLGLGRVGTSACIDRLWQEAASPDKLLARSAVGGLQIAGDPALQEGRPLEELIAVAGGVRSARADEILRKGLKDPNLAAKAAQASLDRPSLASALSAGLRGLDVDTKGDLADLLIQALSSTDEGTKALQLLRANPSVDALVKRRLD